MQKTKLLKIIPILSIITFFIIPVFSSTNTITRSLTSKSSMQEPRSGLEIAVVNNKIYAIGGTNEEGFRSTVEEYDITSDTWSFKINMPTPRSKFGIAVIDNKIYCIGGYTNGFSATNTTEVYDPATDTWETKTPMPTARMDIEANVVNNKIYIIGGIPNATINEVYDPITDSWQTDVSIPNAVYSYASAVINNSIYIINSNTTQIYSIENGSWHYGTPPILATVLSAAGATASSGIPEQIYVYSADADLPYWQLTLRNFTIQSYDPKTDRWSICFSTSQGRLDTGMAIVNDTIYVIGGYTIDSSNDEHTINPTITYCTENDQYILNSLIPEFSSWIGLPFFLSAITVTMLYKKLHNKQETKELKNQR